ncbi:MAG: hypothetical protein MRK01_10635 [Candidatus Scalindua sp.]|nr:hypothetical protein [Candidatus Scalindua sp.]
MVKSFEEFHPLSPPPAGDSNVPLTEGDSGGGLDADTSIVRTGETIRQSEWRDELRKKRSSNEIFWLVGQPDIKIHKLKESKVQVEVMGFDYYNPKTGNVESGGKKNISMWMVDTDYDNRLLFPSQVFFPMAGSGDGRDKLARNLKAEIDEEKIESFKGTVSLPFEPGSAVAIKIIDDRGIESLRVINR